MKLNMLSKFELKAQERTENIVEQINVIKQID